MRPLILLLALPILALACRGGSQDDTSAASDVSPAVQLGREIGDTYLLLLSDAKAMLELNLPAEQLRPALRVLRDDYRVRFANLGCLREDIDEVDRPQVARTADDYVSINGGGDTAWLTQAKSRYAADPEITALLADIETLRVYAFFDQLARVHPGETVQCN
jgi:hypothetical protein